MSWFHASMSQRNALPVLHPASSIDAMLNNGPRRLRSANGVFVEDETGRQLLDGTAGLWCVNVGHGREEIAQTLAEAASTLDYFHTFGGFSNDAQERLGERLTAMAPSNLAHVFFGSSGSDANDTIMKIVWHYNNLIGRSEKKKFISRWGAYHGTSISTASLTGLTGFHRMFDLPIAGVLHTDCPHHYRFAEPGESEAAFVDRLIASLEALIASEGAETIAAFIGEPLMGAGGVVPPPRDYWQRVQEVCRRHDILVVADEVVCGFGRTGRDFGSLHYGIEPDLMATAKGITSGVFPFSAAFLSSEIWSVLHEGSKTLGGFSHGYTYSGHPIGAAVANTVLDIYEREELAANAAHIGAYLMNALKHALSDHPHVGEIRGAGLVCAVQLVADRHDKVFFNPAVKAPAKVSEAAYRRGLIVRPLPSVGALALSPPLTLSRDEADRIVAALIPAIDEGLAELSPEPVQ